MYETASLYTLDREVDDLNCCKLREHVFLFPIVDAWICGSTAVQTSMSLMHIPEHQLRAILMG